MISTCQCDHCGAAVEFELDQWQEGAIGDCPHCGQETRLRRVDLYEPPKAVAKNRAELQAKLRSGTPKWQPVGNGGEVVLFLVGFFMIATGAFAFLGLFPLSELAAVLLGCTGFILVGLSLLLGAVRNLAEKP